MWVFLVGNGWWKKANFSSCITRKRSLLLRSVIRNKRLGSWPESLAATSDWPGRFPEFGRNMESGIYGQLDQNADGTSKWTDQKTDEWWSESE